MKMKRQSLGSMTLTCNPPINVETFYCSTEDGHEWREIHRSGASQRSDGVLYWEEWEYHEVVPGSGKEEETK
jgi:hypothetical protein